MNAPHIVVMDLAGSACPAERCDHLNTLFRKAFLEPEPHIQRVTHLPLVTISPLPDLLFLRPSPTQTLMQLVPRLRRGGTPVPLIGLCCTDRETPATVWQSLRNGLDDFLCCPFTELDLVPRVSDRTRRDTNATDLWRE